MWTIDAADVVAENMFGEPHRIAAVRAADVTGAVGVQLVNIFEPFALKIFVEWHCLRCDNFHRSAAILHKYYSAAGGCSDAMTNDGKGNDR